jgi:hypothetical protein
MLKRSIYCFLSLSLLIPEASAQHLRPPQLDIVVKRNKTASSKTESRTEKPRDQEGQGRVKSTKRTTESFQIEATIKSKEVKRTFKEYTADVYVLGVSLANKRDFILLDKVTTTFDLVPRGVQVFKTKPVTLKSSKGRGGDKGQKYSGYLVVVKDDKGELVKSRASKTSFMKKVEMLDAAKIGDKIQL